MYFFGIWRPAIPESRPRDGTARISFDPAHFRLSEPRQSSSGPTHLRIGDTKSRSREQQHGHVQRYSSYIGRERGREREREWETHIDATDATIWFVRAPHSWTRPCWRHQETGPRPLWWWAVLSIGTIIHVFTFFHCQPALMHWSTSTHDSQEHGHLVTL